MDFYWKSDDLKIHSFSRYGCGVYLAEASSKSDEYSEEKDGLRTMLLCRTVLESHFDSIASGPVCCFLLFLAVCCFRLLLAFHMDCGCIALEGGGVCRSVLMQKQCFMGSYSGAITVPDAFWRPGFVRDNFYRRQ